MARQRLRDGLDHVQLAALQRGRFNAGLNALVAWRWTAPPAARPN